MPDKLLPEKNVRQLVITFITGEKGIESLSVFGDCLAMTGYSSDELTTDSDFWLEIVPCQQRKMVADAFARALAGENSLAIEHEIKHRNGRTITVLDTMSFSRANPGAGAVLVVILQDFSALFETEKALHESLEFRQRVFASSPMPIIIMDAETHRFIDCNQAAVEIYQHSSRDETLGKTPLDVSAALQYDGSPSLERAEHFISIGRARGSVVFEWRHQRPTGELWDAEVHLLRFFSDGKELMQFSLIDITERNRAKNELFREKERLKRILQASPVGLLLMDRSRVISGTNYAMTTLIMRDPAEIVGLRSGEAIGCVNSRKDPRGCGFGENCSECVLRRTIETVIAENSSVHNVEIPLDLVIGGRIQKRWLKIDEAMIDLQGEAQVIVAVNEYRAASGRRKAA
jgi:PAS domain S-box-containing protein